MSDAPDPLGKRALYWAPAERHEDGPRTAHEADIPGKHALFSPAGSGVRPAEATAAPRSSGAAGVLPGRTGHPSHHHLPGDRPAPGLRERYAGSPPDDLERPVGAGMFGSLVLHCSSCWATSQVDLLEYIVLHLPVWFWRPGRGHTRFMTCPGCHRRTWVSASWTSSSR